MAEEFIEIRKTEGGFAVRARMEATIQKEEDWYVIYCPTLAVCTQGQTVKEAEANIKEASELLIESCLERNVFDRLMKRILERQKRAFKKLRAMPAVTGMEPLPSPIKASRLFNFSAQFKRA